MQALRLGIPSLPLDGDPLSRTLLLVDSQAFPALLVPRLLHTEDHHKGGMDRHQAQLLMANLLVLQCHMAHLLLHRMELQEVR